MSFLASVGRAQPSRNMAQVLNTKLNIEQGERRERLVNAQTALSAENLRQLQRKGEFEEQEMSRQLKPWSIDVLAPQVEGGQDGPMFKMMYRMAESMGLVDKSAGGLGTINERDWGVLQKAMAEPAFAQKMSNTRIDYWRGQLGQVDAELKEKDGDQKLLEKRQGVALKLQAAIAANKPLADFIIEQEKLKTKTGTGQLTAKSTRTVPFYDEENERWMETVERFNPTMQSWEVESTGPKFKQSKEEIARTRRKKLETSGKLAKFQEKHGAMGTYADGWKMNEDGTRYLDAEGLPVKLPSWEKVTGKRTNVKAIKIAGEQLDDSLEVIELLKDPQVQADFERELSEPGIMQRIGGMTKNALRKWAQQRGIGANTESYEALTRMHRMASDVRKEMLGTAVTMTEIKSITSWLPDAGDNYESMVAKMNVNLHETAEGFKRWLDVFKDNANMAPFYKAFGWDRFNMPDFNKYKIGASSSTKPPIVPDVQAIGDAIQAEHPDWTKEQVVEELRKRTR